ncbi:MAG: hypothetical protein GKS03_05395 [Alphaproteobacteria bacterium]|nr:hypothetical protein [Alphaproteobacteria bacterium]
MKLFHTIAAFGFLVLAGSASAQDAKLSDFPFWQKMSGWWASENTYFTADMDYTVRSYNSLVHIELDGKKFTESEHRFYPAGIATTRYGNGLMGPGEGVELIIITTGELVDDEGTLGNVHMDHSSGPFDPSVEYRVLSNDDGVRVRPNAKTGIDTYRMYFNFTTPNHRFRSNVGLLYEEGQDIGGLRAFILYRDKRMTGDDFKAKRAEFRARHNVKVLRVVDPDNPGKSLVTRLD